MDNTFYTLYCTVCTDLMYNTVHPVEYRSHVQHSTHCTGCTDLMYVRTTQYTLYSMYRSHIQHSTHCTVCTDPTLSLTSQVKVKKWYQTLYQTEKRNRRQIVTSTTCWGMQVHDIHVVVIPRSWCVLGGCTKC